MFFKKKFDISSMCFIFITFASSNPSRIRMPTILTGIGNTMLRDIKSEAVTSKNTTPICSKIFMIDAPLLKLLQQCKHDSPETMQCQYIINNYQHISSIIAL
jgi:hypothetical protein